MLKDRTPAHMRCAMTIACPGVYENDAGDYVIVGKRPTQETLDELSEKIGDDEWAVMVPDEMRQLVEQFVSENPQSDD